MQPTQVHRNTSQNGARSKIMRALYTEGMLPITEVCELCGLTAKQARDNLGAAKNDGLVVAERDDVTSRLAFKLTANGKKWVTDRGLHLKNSKASQEADVADVTEEAAEIGEASENTREPVVDDAPENVSMQCCDVVEEKPHCGNAETDGTLYGTWNTSRMFSIFSTMAQAIDNAKATAESSGENIPVYKLAYVGSTRTTVDFVAEDATA